MLNYLAFTLIGLVGLVFASDIVVAGAQRIARALKVSEFFIGLTITSIGTSLPEIFTNVAAAINLNKGLSSASGIAIGNIIGSNISNITLIVGIAGLLGALGMRKEALKRDGIMMIFTSLLFVAMSLNGIISRLEGIILLMIFVGYILFVMEREKFVKEVRTEPKSHIIFNLFFIAIGIAAVVYFADIMVVSGVKLAQYWGVRESLIGVFVGLGTSAPEISVSVTAAFRKSAELSLGNLIGSNIINILIALGIGAAISGFIVSKPVIMFDMVFLIVASAIPLLILFEHAAITRRESGILILLYALFLYLKIVFSL
ncbi:calcium/sodium antiporter [Candidatus Woesearchaeota archaeon]|nr:calcium/sodium antiporter [Candidatus Woesearchaeota archaeon]